MQTRNWRVTALLCAVLTLCGVAIADERESEITALEAQIAETRAALGEMSAQLASSRQDADMERNALLREQVREILSEQEFRESLQRSTLSAGYDNGFFIRGADDDFELRFNALLQYRWTYYNQQTNNRYLNPRFQRDDRTGFDFNRIRLFFRGHVYNRDITYQLQLAADAARRYDFGLAFSWLDYRIDDALHFRLGKMKIASTRENITPHANLQFPARSILDAVYGLGFGYGLRVWGELADGELQYMVDVMNGPSDGEGQNAGRVITNDPSELDANPMVAARLAWRVLGEGKDFARRSDLALRESPAWELAAYYVFNEDDGDQFSTRIPFPQRNPGLGVGAFGLTRTNGLQTHQAGIDTLYKHGGLSLSGAYALRVVDVRNARRRPSAPWALLTGDDSTTAQHGGLVQAGYFLPIPGAEDKWEIIGRVAGISALAETQEAAWQYGAGVNYYIQGNDVKLQADVSYVDEAPTSTPYHSLANVNDEALVFRVQLQVAF